MDNKTSRWGGLSMTRLLEKYSQEENTVLMHRLLALVLRPTRHARLLPICRSDSCKSAPQSPGDFIELVFLPASKAWVGHVGWLAGLLVG